MDEYPKVPAHLNYDFYVGPAEWTPYHPERLDWNWRWWMKFGGSQMMDWIGHHGDIAHMAMDWDETGPVKVEPLKWEFSKERNNLYDSPESYEFMCTYEGGTTLRVSVARMTICRSSSRVVRTVAPCGMARTTSGYTFLVAESRPAMRSWRR